jgi:hypothetical protein
MMGLKKTRFKAHTQIRIESYCPTGGMGEKPWPLGEDFSLSVDVASRIQGVQGPRIQGKAWMVF